MGPHQLHQNQPQLLAAIRGLGEKLGFHIFYDSSLLKMINSMGGNSIDDGIAMDRHEIDPISAQIVEINSPQMNERDLALNPLIGTDVEGLAPELTFTNAMEEPKIKDDESIGRIDGQLNANLIPTHMVVESCPLAEAPPTLITTPPITPLIPMPPANSSMKISSNYDPPPPVSLKNDQNATKLTNGTQGLAQQTKKRPKYTWPPFTGLELRQNTSSSIWSYGRLQTRDYTG